MPLIHLPSPWTLQPQTNNPIAADVAVSGAQPIECVSQRILAKTGTVSQKPTDRGLAWSVSSSSYLTLNDGPTLGGKTNLTIFALFRTTSTSSNGASIYCERGTSGNAILKIIVGRTYSSNERGIGFVYRNDGGVLRESYQQVSDPTDGKWHTGAIVKRGQSWSIYQDGALVKTDTFGSASDAFTLTGIKTTVGTDVADIAGSSFVGDIPIVLGFGVALSTAAIAELHANPWRLFQPDELFVGIPDAGGGAAALAGSASSQASASGALTTQIPLVGATVGVSTATGALTTQIPLAGASASVAVSSGVLTTTVQLSGAALAQVVASASLAGGAAALSGSAAESVTATGTLTTQITLSGAAVAQALATAGLTIAPSGLAGSAAAIASSSGALSTGIALVGQVSALAVSAGGLTTGIPLTGNAASVSEATGSLTVTSGFSAAALAQEGASGSLSTQIRLNAATVMQALVTGALTSFSMISPSLSRSFIVSAEARENTVPVETRRLSLPA